MKEVVIVSAARTRGGPERGEHAQRVRRPSEDYPFPMLAILLIL